MPLLSSLATVCALLELAINLGVCLPISVLNFVVIFHTQIIHRNLKFVLLCQCFAVVLYATVRIVEFAVRICTASDVFSSNQMFALFSVRIFSIVFGDWLGFILLIERCMATIWANTYEHNKRNSFRVLSLLFTAVITGTCYWTGIDRKSSTMVNKNAVPEFYAAICVSFVCFWVWHVLDGYNKRRYALTCRQGQHHLSERYQLSENIRTFRQLLPTIVLHFVNTYFTIGCSLLMSSSLLQSAEAVAVVAAAIFLVFSISNTLMQITVILFHPILNRKLDQLLRMLKRPQRVESELAERPNIVPKNLNGEALVREQKFDEHFEALRLSWT